MILETFGIFEGLFFVLPSGLKHLLIQLILYCFLDDRLFFVPDKVFAKFYCGSVLNE